ncbi:hypothetical protein ATJ97_1234 [Georgenia soli]|uniref:Heavy metal transporter n=1 Tax=Georgenia soli TaxID=638953 RepID=A0A2A9EI41_9MICO|nr:hypothetical protein [Georgenia soli]PFG38747.1 hypothetical protein ATJ97_1234 [Georgenia soli]
MPDGPNRARAAAARGGSPASRRRGPVRTTGPRRRARGCGTGALTALGALGLSVGAVVLALNVFTGGGASGTCVATLDDGTRAALDADQADNAALMAAIAVRRELPARGVTVAVATALQESKLRNIDYGDRDSVGLFQQRPSQGWGTVEQIMDPVYSTNAFYDVLVTVQGWESKAVTEAAQDVQRSAFPDAYAQHEGRGRAFASALTGYSPAALTCHLDDVPAESGSAVGAGSGTTASPTAPQRLAAVQDRLARDFGEVDTEVAPGGVLLVDGASLPAGLDPAPARRGWAVAQWAVATASATDARVVATDGMAWVRADGDDAAWVPLADAGLPATVAETAAEAGPGAVVIG